MLADILALAFGVDLASKPTQNLRKGEGITPQPEPFYRKARGMLPAEPSLAVELLAERARDREREEKYALDSYALVAYLQDEAIADQDDLPAIHHRDGGRPP